MMFKNLEHTCIIINKETLHDTCVALIRDLKVSDNNTFEIKNDQAKHMLVIQANQIPFNQKYADQMEKANITFSELNSPVGTIRLRYQEAITKDPDIYVNEYIPKLKKILRALKRAKEVRENLVFDNSANINYDFTINKNNIAISEINKKTIKEKFLYKRRQSNKSI